MSAGADRPTAGGGLGPAPPDGDIRAATGADLAQLAALEAAAFADPWTVAMLAAELAHPGALTLVAGFDAVAAASADPQPARPDGEPRPIAGYACFQRAADEAELLRVAVLPALRHRGLGRRLVAAGLAILRARGVTHCHLEVRPANASALAVYQALGFALTGRRPRYYRDGSDALILSRDL